MAPSKDAEYFEVPFCSDVKEWSNQFFATDSKSPFKKVKVEDTDKLVRQRADLKIFGAKDKLLVSGEVKMPGTVEGRDPYDAKVLEDASTKAQKMGAPYFFTWNVNKLVLFDRSKFDLPLAEQRLREFPLYPEHLNYELEEPAEVKEPHVMDAVKKLLAKFYGVLSDIITGRTTDWGMKPDDYFVSALRSHLDWPVKLTAEHLRRRADADRAFDGKLQEWMKGQGWPVVRADGRQWKNLLERTSRSLCYIFSNRAIFYGSVRRHFPELPELNIPKNVETETQLRAHFRNVFNKALRVTGDYETIFYPEEDDWAGEQVFGHEDAAEAWRVVLGNIHRYDFQSISTDILGAIFKKLIAPAERRRFGQVYTSEDLVDVVNAFCIHDGKDKVLDPACGSGSFLVRVYARKAYLQERTAKGKGDDAHAHQSRLEEIYGCDISLFAAHLTTLNLAAREIALKDNYPRVARRNFFVVPDSRDAFCRLPVIGSTPGPDGSRPMAEIALPELDAVVANPPYVRQERIPKRATAPSTPTMQAKEDLQVLMGRLWPGLQLTGRSDLHCYFWPAAAALLKPDGWLGLVVSSNWLDVEYGFPLQRWLLQHFKIHAVLESEAEPWFEDARVRTTAVILQRCANSAARDANLVKFVRLDVTLEELLGTRNDEAERQQAAEKLRDTILATRDFQEELGRIRIIPVSQAQLWQEGVKAGNLFSEQAHEGGASIFDTDEADPDEEDEEGITEAKSL